MDRTNQDWTITEGADVMASDGDKVGKVTAVLQDGLGLRWHGLCG